MSVWQLKTSIDKQTYLWCDFVQFSYPISKRNHLPPENKPTQSPVKKIKPVCLWSEVLGILMTHKKQMFLGGREGYKTFDANFLAEMIVFQLWFWGVFLRENIQKLSCFFFVLFV